MCDYAIRFWEALRSQYQLRQPNIILRPVAEPLHISADEGPSLPKLLIGGNYVLLRNLTRLQILDIRARIQYNIIGPPGFTPRHFCADVVRFNGREGLLLVVSDMGRKPAAQCVDILFQPFSTDARSLDCPVVEHIASIAPKFHDSFSNVVISAHRYLVIFEDEYDTGGDLTSFIQIYDLVHGEKRGLASNDFFRHAEVCNDLLILLSWAADDDHKGIRFDGLHEDAKHSRPLQYIAERASSSPSSFPTRALYHLWGQEVHRPYRQGVGNRGPRLLVRSFYGCKPGEEQQAYDGPAGASLDASSWLSGCFMTLPVKSYFPSELVPASNNQPHLSSNITPRFNPNLSGLPGKSVHCICVPSSSGQWALSSLQVDGLPGTLVLSELDDDLRPHPSLTHHRVHIRREGLDTVEPFTIECREGSSFYPRWDEYSGRVVIQSFEGGLDTAQDPGLVNFTISVYEFDTLI
ncbi:hypothetical protein DL93DRAFT_2072878 [Clavulina sp. PMI_390]|nr:hypothetical protein DL93DRAFT_2072878 [Clavulina sp. PMI_390]